MKGVKGLLWGLLLLWLAAVAQTALAPRMTLAGGTPDFPLAFLACAGLYCNRRQGTLLGFGAGLVQGIVTGANLTLYVASRTLAGFLIGWFMTLDVEVTWVVSSGTAVILTLLAQFTLLFLGAHHGPLFPFVEGTLTTAVYNGVIAVPVYALLNRFLSVPNYRTD
jgi:rod shape-determining protein MreD